MSYDLYLRRDKALGSEEFNAYFSARPNYRCENRQAVYANEATGVYFVFDLADADADPPHTLAFNLNFYRPHFFGLEAAPELKLVVEHFGFKISDPQNDGMGEGPFSVEGFLRGWNHGNEFGYHAILGAAEPPKTVWARPGPELEGIWRWNFQKDKIQESLGEGIFVPRIFWGILDGELFSMVVWPDGIPTLIPQVDMLVIGRDELAPMRFFVRSKDTCHVPASAFDHLLAPGDEKSWPLPAHFPRYKTPPSDLRKSIQGLKSDSRKPAGVTMDDVLNRELVERFRKRA